MRRRSRRRVKHRVRRRLTPIRRSQMWVWAAPSHERWWSRVLRRRRSRIRVRTPSGERRRSTGVQSASCSSCRVRTGRCCGRSKIIVARTPDGTGRTRPGGAAMDQAVWTNDQREDDLRIGSKADIQVRLTGGKKNPKPTDSLTRCSRKSLGISITSSRTFRRYSTEMRSQFWMDRPRSLGTWSAQLTVFCVWGVTHWSDTLATVLLS